MAILRSNLPGSGSAKITWNGGEFWARDNIAISLAMNLAEQRSSMYGRVAKTRGGRSLEINIPLFALWENLSLLFPSTILNPTIGSRMFGTSDLPMVLLCPNGDKLTIHNVRLTGLSSLTLAANATVFSGTARFTGLIKDNGSPTDANAYYTFQTAQAYTEGSFALTNLKAKTWTGAWGSRTGFTSIQTQAGWTVDWEVGTTPDLVDGVGPVDMFIDNFWGRASCIPVGPTMAQIEGQQRFQSTGAGIGTDITNPEIATPDDLVLTDGTSTLTLKRAGLVETGLVFAPSVKRIGPTVWETSRGFSAGAPQALAAVA